MGRTPAFSAPLLVGLLLFAGGAVGGPLYSVRHLEVPVDHFSFARNDTFRMKYLINDTFWDREAGPIFFYTGNEGAIEMFANNTGFVWEIAPKFGALVVFAEHRYYGESLPFGKDSLRIPQNAGYLTSQQALADFVDLMEHLRANGTGKNAVVAFGGSYGGMLAAYARIKYPHEVAGAIAASAPVLQFSGLVPCEAFSAVATRDFRVEGETCPRLVRRSWTALNELAAEEEGLSWLSKEWRLCRPLTAAEVPAFKGWLADAYVDLAMANYPYPANFLADLPAYPVRQFCRTLQNETLAGKDLLSALFRGVSVYFNRSGKAECLSWKTGMAPLGEEGWSYQTCTEMVMPICQNGVDDMFEPFPWDLEKYSDECWRQWKVRPDANLAERTYGGRRIRAASNIIFSNGLLDPWVSGGVISSPNPRNNLLAVVIPEGAHHLDLRGSNPADPPSVRKARIIYEKYIHLWIKDYQKGV